MSERFEGGCFCKKVRYALTTAPFYVHCCHCRDCQKHTGSAFVLNAMIETDRLEFTGDLEVSRLTGGDGGPHDIYRCAACRTAVWSDYGDKSWRRLVRVGTLDDPSAFPPDVHIFTRSKLPWVQLPEGVPSFEAFYEPKEVWPAEVMARVKAARSPG